MQIVTRGARDRQRDARRARSRGINSRRLSRLTVALVGALMFAGATACGSSTGDARPDAASNPSPTARPTENSSPQPQASPTAGCGTSPPRHAWVQAVSTDGTERWKTPLKVAGGSGNEQFAPLLGDGRVVAAQDGTITSLDEESGRVQWVWQGGKSVYGMWLHGGTVVVLTDQVGDQAAITALDRSDGHQQWRQTIPTGGLLGDVIATPSGRLAWVRADGAVQVLNMDDGTLRWSHPGARSPALIYVDGRVVFATASSVRAYNEATGVLDWTATHLPPVPHLTAAEGRVLVSSATSGGASPTSITALDSATGGVDWRFDNGSTQFVFAADQQRILLASAYLSAGLLDLDDQTGKPLWRANSLVQSFDTSPVLTPDVLVGAEGGVANRPKARLVARALQSGREVWAASLPGPLIGREPVRIVGPLVVGALPPQGRESSSVLRAFRLADGKASWSVRAPTLIQAPVGVDATTIAVQSADPGYSCAY